MDISGRSYNSLQDKYLVDYFSSPAVRRHLVRMGLLATNGRIIGEKEYKERVLKTERIEREKREQEDRRKRDEDWKRYRRKQKRQQDMLNMSGTLKSQYKEISPFLSLPSLDFSLSKITPPESPSRDNSGNEQQPKRDRTRLLLGPILGLTSQQLIRTVNRLHPSTPGDKSLRSRPPTAAPCQVTLHFVGRRDGQLAAMVAKTKHLLVVQQQVKDNVMATVYKGWVQVEDKVTFNSRREKDHPFSLVVWLNNNLHARFNSCCETKRYGERLGGPGGQFILAEIIGTPCCFKCESMKDNVVVKLRKQIRQDKMKLRQRHSAAHSTCSDETLSSPRRKSPVKVETKPKTPAAVGNTNDAAHPPQTPPDAHQPYDSDSDTFEEVSTSIDEELEGL